MPDSDRGNQRPIIVLTLCLLIAVLALVTAGAIGFSWGVENESRRASTHQHAESGKANAQRACIGREAAAMLECVYEQVERSQETARAEQDLNAQQDMALWAFLMAVISAATMILTAIALWFVRGTLNATLQAVEDTGRATQEMIRSNEISDQTSNITIRSYNDQVASVRPVVQLDVENCLVRARPIESLYNSLGKGQIENLTMRYSFKNMGKQPCWIEAAWIGFYVSKYNSGFMDIPSVIPDQFRVLTAGFIQPNESIGGGGGLYTLYEEHLHLLSQGGAGVVLFGVCQYRSLAKHLFSTRFAYIISVGENSAWRPTPVDDRTHWLDGRIRRPKRELHDAIEYLEYPGG